MTKLFKLMILIVLALTLVSCAQTPTAEATKPATGELQTPAVETTLVNVKMVYWPGPESDAMQKIVEYYNANKSAESGVTVTMVLFSREGFWEKQDTLMAAGSNEVDMYFTASYSVGKMAPYMEPLEPYYARPEVSGGGSMDTFIASTLDSLKVDGKLYAIPLDVSNHFMYYRKDLIDQLLSDATWQAKYTEIAEAELGKDLSPKNPEEWVWDDYLATILFFTKKYNPDSPTEYGTALGAKNIIYNTMIWDNVLYSMGGSWWKDDGKTPAFDTAEAKQAAELYRFIVEKEATPPGSSSYEYPEQNEAFKSGKAAVMLQWSSAFNELTDKEQSPVWEKVWVAPIPGPKPSTHVHALGVGINSKSTNKDAAFKWISFLSTTEAMQMYAENGGIPPVSQVLTGMGDVKVIFPIISEHVDKYGYVESTSPQTVPILEVLSKRLSAAWAGEISIDDALSQAQQEIENLLPK